MNCHYLTRRLQKPWEWATGSLWHFDFGSGLVKPQHTKYSFAKPDTNTDEVERLFNRYIEKPLAEVVDRVMSVSPLIDDFELMRASYLYFVCQVKRHKKANATLPSYADGQDLDTTLRKGEDYLNGLTHFGMEFYHLVRVVMPEEHRLFFNEQGIFPVGFYDQEYLSGQTLGYALPVDPSIALVLAPRSASLKDLEQFKYKLMEFSVGYSPEGQRLIVPPSIKERYGDQFVKDFCLEAREKTANLIWSIQDLRDKTVELNEAQGFKVESRLPGLKIRRINPVV